MKNKKQLIDRAEVYRRACAGCTRHGEAPMECYHDEPCKRLIFEFTTAEPVNAVEVVRCKDCEHWQDCKVKLADGTYRDYRPDEVFGDVTLDKGINVGSHCTLHGYENSSGSWFWAKPDDYCSRGERRTDNG